MPRIEQWHVWFKDPKTNARRWIGQFYSEKDAMGWRKAQDNPLNYTINNIGPDIGKVITRQMPSDEMERRRQQRAADRKRQQARYNAVRDGQVTQAARKQEPKSEEQQLLEELAAGLLDEHKDAEQSDLDKGINR